MLESLYSNQVSAMASDALGPAQVTGLNFSVQQGKVILTWDPVTTNADSTTIDDLAGYRIYRKDSAGDTYALIGTVDAATTTYTDESMKDGATYFYAVAAFDDEETPNIGQMSADLQVFTIPSVPQNLVAGVSDGKITLDWDSVLNASDPKLNENLTGYNIYRSETDGTGYVKIGTVGRDVNNYVDDTIQNNITYYYVVTAVDENH